MVQRVNLSFRRTNAHFRVHVHALIHSDNKYSSNKVTLLTISNADQIADTRKKRRERSYKKSSN